MKGCRLPMRPVLMIAPYFAPQAAVGALRSVKLARRLPERGFRPVVLCGSFPEDERDSSLNVPDGVVVWDAYLDRSLLALRAAAQALGMNRSAGKAQSAPLRGMDPVRGPIDRYAIHALHAAGYESGQALWDSLRRGPGRELAAGDEATFWTRLAGALSRRGWGSLTHDSPHPGVGLLASADWAEAQAGAGERQPSCTVSAGMLSALLSGAAGGPVAVLEVTCRTRGDQRCTFAFGSSATVHDLYGLLLDGQDLHTALAAL